MGLIEFVVNAIKAFVYWEIGIFVADLNSSVILMSFFNMNFVALAVLLGYMARKNFGIVIASIGMIFFMSIIIVAVVTGG